MEIAYEGQVLWAQIDANQHMRHSAYADFGAQARLMMLEKFGMGAHELYKNGIGPVVFREEMIYLREVRMNDYLKVSCELTKSRADGSRWSIRHEIYRSDGVKAAIINIDGAWIDIAKRKLALLPPELTERFNKAPKSEDYIEDVPRQKP